jgi:Fe-S cluster assembly scaffold protein SufB
MTIPKITGASILESSAESVRDMLPSLGFSLKVAERIGSVLTIVPDSNEVRISRHSHEDNNILHLKIPAGRMCSLVDESYSSGERAANIVLIEVSEDAVVDCVFIQDSSVDILIREIHVISGARSRVRLHTLDFGAKVLLSRTTNELREHSHCNISNTFFSSESQVFSLRSGSRVCESGGDTVIEIRGASSDRSKAIAKSLIRIENGSLDSKGLQSEEVILLDEGAEVNVLPELEIETSAVKCAHKATSGGLDDEKLFYSQSRGLTPDETRKIIVEGFFNSAMRDLSPELRLKAESILRSKV